MDAFSKGMKAAQMGLPESGCLLTGAMHQAWINGYRSYKANPQPDYFNPQAVMDAFEKEHFKTKHDELS